MMIVISGSNGSGKSVFAEGLAAGLSCPRYYIATMVSQTEENERRIEKHRRQRAGLDFVTIEEPCFVSCAGVTEDSLVLLEDASNLLANLVFGQGGRAEQALEEILKLKNRCRHLLVVTISGLCPENYDGETAAYIRAMLWLNDRLAEAAEGVVTLENGLPVWRKGRSDDLC